MSTPARSIRITPDGSYHPPPSSRKEAATLATDNKPKKQLLLRLSPALWQELAAWAEDDFRSINGQIEYLLTECVRRRRKGKSMEPTGEDPDGGA